MISDLTAKLSLLVAICEEQKQEKSWKI